MIKKIEFKNATELARFIESALPSIKQTGKAKDLRKIKPDPKSKGKAVIIWWGNSNINDVTELRVTVHLGVSNMALNDPSIPKACEFLLKEAFLRQHGEVQQEKQEKVEVPADVPVDVPAILEDYEDLTLVEDCARVSNNKWE